MTATVTRAGSATSAGSSASPTTTSRPTIASDPDRRPGVLSRQRMRWRLRGAFVVVVALGLSPSAPVLAQQPSAAEPQPQGGPANRTAARVLAEEGLAHFDRGEFDKALEFLNKADAIMNVPTVDLYAARSLVKLGRLADAAARYFDVIKTKLDADAPPAFKTAVEEAERERASLLPRVPVVSFVIEGGIVGASLLLDGEAIAPETANQRRLLNPGKHRLEGKRGSSTAEEEFTVQEGQTKAVTLKLPKPPPPPLAPTAEVGQGQRKLGWVGVGVGGVGLALWAVTGGITVALRSRLLNRGCDAGRCPAGIRTDDYRALRVTSAVGFWAGLTFAAAGTTLLLTAPSDPPAGKPPQAAGGVKISPYIAGLSGGVQGAF